MSKKCKRILSAVLVFLLVVCAALPVPAVEASSVRDVEQQIIRLYKRAKDYYGWDSFDGYCGTFVSVQLYLMGINTSMVRGNGNQQFDNYRDLKYTTGGYRIRAYSSKNYTLKQALNAVCDNGTKDVYNLLIGFQSTSSTLGKRYGHACVIQAILDGRLYFMESYDMKIGGTRHPEGAPISCTIDEFVNYYAKSAVFEGVILFGQKSYAEQCRVYPSNLVVTAQTGAVIRTEPCDARTDSRSELLRRPAAGEELRITALYQNTAGEYWYQINEDEGYIRGTQVQLSQMLFDDIRVSSPSAPAVLRQGKSFKVKGSVLSDYNDIYTLRAQVYRLEETGETLVINAVDSVENKSYALKDSGISKDLTFRKLELGHYRYDLAAIVGNYYVVAGQLQIGWETVALWSSDFQVLEESSGYDIVSFDSRGGTADLDQMAVTVGTSIGTLPVARREGYVFLGWYTQEEEGDAVTDAWLPEGDTTLYAHWIDEQVLYDSWQEQGDCLYFYSDGMTTMGCIEKDGLLYYFSSMGELGQNWTMWTAAGAA